MYISEKLRKENQSEYLLYLWSVEDLIRSCQLDIDVLRERVVKPYQLTEEQEEAYVQWLQDRINMMREEDVVETGHLQIHKNVMIKLSDLHQQLLDSPKFPFYSGAYYKALPFVVEFRAKSEAEKRGVGEIESCFEMLYQVMMLRLRKQEITEQTMKALEPIQNFISLLANYKEKDDAGELEFK